jgi:hypothetical protein
MDGARRGSNGKIYDGQDVTDGINYFGSAAGKPVQAPRA